MKTPYDKLAKIYAKYFCHLNKMAATPIYGKNPLKIFISIFCKVDFLNTFEAKVIFLTGYVETNETMLIDKFQRSRLTFNFSAKVAHIGVPSTH